MALCVYTQTIKNPGPSEDQVPVAIHFVTHFAHLMVVLAKVHDEVNVHVGPGLDELVERQLHVVCDVAEDAVNFAGLVVECQVAVDVLQVVHDYHLVSLQKNHVFAGQEFGIHARFQ